MQTMSLFNADQTVHSNPPAWQVVTDQVMGGKSQATMHYDNQVVHFNGQVSLANNGGFIQIQWPLKNNSTLLNLQACMLLGVPRKKPQLTGF